MMETSMRTLLFLGAALSMLYFLAQIRKKRLQISYAISWSIFSGLILLMGIFPDAIVWLSQKIGFESPANLVYLIIIFILIFKLFTNTAKLSDMNRQITNLTQYIAIRDASDVPADVKDHEATPPLLGEQEPAQNSRP